MSRFWAGGESSESEQSSDEESIQEQTQFQKQTEKKFAAAFDDSDSGSEDEVRVVKSAKDKTWESLQDGITKLKNARRNGDWGAVQDQFNNVNKIIEKSKTLIQKNGGTPGFYIRMLAELEDSIQAALQDKEGFKKLKPIMQRSLNQLKLQVKKYNNENFKAEIADFRVNPDKYQDKEESDESSDEEEDDESDSDSDSDSGSSSSSSSSSEEDSDAESDDLDVKKKPPAKPAAKAPVKPAVKKADDSDSDSDDSLFARDEDADDESSESEDERKELKGRARWLKKVPDQTAEKNKEAKRDAKKQQQQSNAQKKKKEFADIHQRRAMQQALNTRTEDKLTEEELDKKVAELVASRGRKSTDAKEVLRSLEVLTKAARLHGPAKEIPVQMHLISMFFDAQKSIDDFMDHLQWRSCYRALHRVVTLLENDHALTLSTLSAEDLSDLSLALTSKKDSANGNPAAAAAVIATSAVTTSNGKVIVRVAGSLATFLVRLEEEYTKAVQHINPHTQEYLDRLADEESLVELAEATWKHYRRIEEYSSASVIALMIVEHKYYKHASHDIAVYKAHIFHKKYGKYLDLHPACRGKLAQQLFSSSSSTPADVSVYHPASFLGNPSVAITEQKSLDSWIEELCNFIFLHGDERLKTRALLCSVYHHAIHDRYFLARDLLLVSHIADFIDKAEIKTQILYNRTIATLGLSAFRLGMFQKAHECFTNICTARLKELLAQGTSRSTDKDPEQERIERRRQMPYHMHINPDLLEACHLTSAMLLELPALAKMSSQHQFNGSFANAPGHVFSRHLRKLLDAYNRQVFIGPPETTREHVLAATKAILSGDWMKASEYLLQLDVWNLLPGDGGAAVKTLLKAKIQEEAVRCFLLVNADSYESIALESISAMFGGLSPTAVKRVISKMIFTKEISAAWEPQTNILILYRAEPSPLQQLSIAVSEKMNAILESHERILDHLVAGGVYGHKDGGDWRDRDSNVQNTRDGNRGDRTASNTGGQDRGNENKKNWNNSNGNGQQQSQTQSQGNKKSRGGNNNSSHQGGNKSSNNNANSGRGNRSHGGGNNNNNGGNSKNKNYKQNNNTSNNNKGSQNNNNNSNAHNNTNNRKGSNSNGAGSV